MKIRNQEIRGFLILMLVATIGALGLFETLSVSQAKLGEYIYSITAERFLASNSQISPKPKSFPSTNGFAEYSVISAKPRLK